MSDPNTRLPQKFGYPTNLEGKDEKQGCRVSGFLGRAGTSGTWIWVILVPPILDLPGSQFFDRLGILGTLPYLARSEIRRFRANPGG